MQYCVSNGMICFSSGHWLKKFLLHFIACLAFLQESRHKLDCKLDCVGIYIEMTPNTCHPTSVSKSSRNLPPLVSLIKYESLHCFTTCHSFEQSAHLDTNNHFLTVTLVPLVGHRCHECLSGLLTWQNTTMIISSSNATVAPYSQPNATIQLWLCLPSVMNIFSEHSVNYGTERTTVVQ